MKMYLKFAALFLVTFTSMESLRAADTPYANAVIGLEPTYYYELNEPDATGGVIDSMGNAEPGSYNGDYENGAPQAGCAGPLFLNEGQDGGGAFEYYETPVPGIGGEANLAHCSNNEGHVLLGFSEDFGASAMTVAMFFRADSAEGGDRLFTNNLFEPDTSFQMVVANDGLVVAVNPNEAGYFAERTLTTEDGGWDRALIQAEYGWFHVVASTSGPEDERADNIQVWVNGVNRTESLVVTEWGWGVDTDDAKIGGRHADPLTSTTHSGAQDEVAIWLDRVLTEEEVQSLWEAALTGPGPSLPGDYNQNGELDVEDLNLQASAIVGGQNPPEFDLNEDGVVDYDGDRIAWLHELKKVYVGDVDLNGEFDSLDFVAVFVAGDYETGSAGRLGRGRLERRPCF